jgi:hypothetical protein
MATIVAGSLILAVKRTGVLRLLDKQLAPAARADFALDDFARVRRLEEDAAVAALVALRRTLIFGVSLTDLLLRGYLRDHGNGCRRAERKRRAGEHDAARDALTIIAVAIHIDSHHA